MPEDRQKVRYDEYEGKPTIVIPLGYGRGGKEYDFSFGLRKAKAILEYLEEIKDFVKAHE